MMDKEMKWVFGVLMIVALAGLILLWPAEPAAKRFWMVDGLLGAGTSATSRYLDSIHSGNSNLASGDYAMFLESSTSEFMLFRYLSTVTGFNHTSSGVSRPFTVVPYDDPSTGLWRECFPSMVSGYVTSGTTLHFGTGVTAPSVFAVTGSTGTSAYMCDGSGNCVDFGDIISDAL